MYMIYCKYTILIALVGPTRDDIGWYLCFAVCCKFALYTSLRCERKNTERGENVR